jgi:zinc protease
MVLVKEADGIKVPTEQELLQIVKASKEKKYEAYVDAANDEPLMAEKPKASKVISKIENKEFGTTTLTFANKVKVVLKPTDFKNDEILFSGYAPGGTSLFEDNQVLAAMFSAYILNTSGFGNFDNIALTKKLAGNTAKLSLTMGEIEQGVNGSAAPKDFETLLQLNYQYITSTRKDDKAFQTFKSMLQNQIKFMSASPEMAFQSKMVKVVSSNNPRIFVLPEEEQVANLTVDAVYSVYEKAFKTANNYTFFIVGNFEIDKIASLLETYLGGLPTSDAKRNFVYRKVDFPKGITKEVVNKGKEQKSSVAMVFKGDWKWSDKDMIASRMVVDALAIKLRESMREDQGGVYGVRANINLSILPKNTYTVNVSWGCAPENVEKLSSTVSEEMKKIADNGPTDDDMLKTKETLIKERETKVKENQYWLSYLKNRDQINQTPLSFEQYKAIVESITKKDLQKLAKNYFTSDHYVRVVLMPEEKQDKKE